MEYKKTLSFVLPVYNEEENILNVYTHLLQVLEPILETYEYEILLIDDGSQDTSWSIIQSMVQQDNHVRGIRFSRNFGQQMALEAGLNEAGGDAVITMDSDGQHPSEIILDFVQKWQDGFQVVNTKRLYTEKISLFKKITSSVFYTVFNHISGFKMEPASSDFRLLDRSVVDFLNSLQESPKFYRGILAWTGFTTAVISFHAAKRGGGKSGYSFGKMYTLALLGITSSSLRPLKIIIVFGVIMSCGASLLLVAAVIAKLMHSVFFSSSALWGSFILVNTGLIIIMLGIIGIYSANILSTLSSRPSYIIKERK